MGPCRCGHGIPVRANQPVDVAKASMGPCRCGHGIFRYRRRLRRWQWASMGPCRCGHGIMRRIGPGSPRPMLQWGHVAVDMEYVASTVCNALIILLQWGHVAVDMEYRGIGANCGGSSSFNGAMSLWTWNTKAVIGLRHNPCGFNGAMSLWTWNMRYHDFRAVLSDSCFNGAMSLWTWNTCHCPCACG